MNRNEEIEKLKDALIKKVKSENNSRYINLSSDEIMKITTDSSIKGKYILWVFREYLKGNIQRFEDMSRIKQALTLFKNNLSKFAEQEKQLNKMSFQELESLVEPYQKILTQNTIKRMNKEKIWSEIEIIYEGPEGRIYIPKTEQASIFLGQGTKWCTASVNDENYFHYYNTRGPIYVFVLNKKDRKGREKKYQLHFETEQFMDSQDNEQSLIHFESKTGLVSLLSENLSAKQKLKLMINNDLFFEFLEKKHGLSEFTEYILTEKAKLAKIKNITSEIESKITTEEFWEIALKNKPSLLTSMSKNKITEKLCKIAVEKEPFSIEYVPDEFMTQELCELALNSEGRVLNNIIKKDIVLKNPQKFNVHNFYKLAVTQNGHSLSMIPSEQVTAEICEIAVLQDGCSIQYMPEKFKNPEMYKKAMSQNGMSLEFLPSEYKTYEFCEIAVTQNGEALRYVPEKFKKKELCEIAVRQNGNALSSVPTKLYTKKLAEIAVETGGFALDAVPLWDLTGELCEKALQKNGIALSCVVAYLRTQKFCEIAVAQNGEALRYVPEKFQTKELCELAVKQNCRALYFLPKELKTHDFFMKSLDIFLNENGLYYSANDALKMIFNTENNPVKNLVRQKKYCIELFKDIYVDIILDEISDKKDHQTIPQPNINCFQYFASISHFIQEIK